jgi:tetratricopeptide (TPR) repeat protein
VHNQPDLLVEMAHGLMLWWSSFGQVIEPYGWLEEALRQDEIAPHIRARGLRVFGALAGHQGQHTVSRSATEESLALAHRIGDRFCAAACLNNLGNHANRAGRYDEAQRLYEDGRALFEAIGDAHNSDRMLFNLTQLALNQGQLAAAEAYLDQYRQFAQAIQTPSVTMGVLSLEGRLAALREEFDAARAAAKQIPALPRTAGKPGVLRAMDLGFIALREGDHAEARAQLMQALAVRYEENRTQDFILTLLYLATAEAGAGYAERAARLFGAAEAWHERLDMVMYPIDRQPYERAVRAARSALDPAAFEAAWAEGRALSLEEVVEYALMGE